MGLRSHRERIYQLYLAKIRAGEITHDDRLIDNSIAQELGVSRMPVRDALMRLTHEGYLVGTTRGFMLPSMSLQRIREVFEIRRLLEPRAAGQACAMLDAARIEQMASAVAAARLALAAGDVQMLYRTSESFRSAWVDAIPSAEMREAIRRYLIQVQSVRMGTMRDAEAQRVVVEGQAGLLDGFRRRDGIAVADAMLRYIQAAEAFYTQLSPEEPS